MAVPNKLPKKIAPKVNTSWKNIILYVLVGFLVLSFALSFLQLPQTNEKEVPLSQTLSDIKENRIKDVVVDGDKITLTYKDGQINTSRKEVGESFVKTLTDSGIDPKSISLTIKDQSKTAAWLNILGTALPILLMVGFFFFIFRQAREAGNGVFSFGQSRAKQFSKAMPQTTFADVAGVDEAKQELVEVVDFLKHPEKYQALGARTPKGVLLVGPAGCGKTLLARAVAGEAGVPFFSAAGSEFMEMLVGVGPARIRDLFANAKKTEPAIIFIDEIEAIGRMRGFAVSGGHDEREQTLNQILVEMDGFTPNESVIVLAATNRPDLLDPALTRPGRFDRRVVLDLPDIEGRKDILKIHMKGKPFLTEVDMTKLAKRTVGFSGADLANMLNEAAILAARGGKKAIDENDLEEAATKVKLGPQRKRMQTEEERKTTAYHEAGHAIVSRMLPLMDPVHRISIVARGMAGGFTLIPPQVDRYNETKTRLLERIATLFGGRAAEELALKDISTGASSDLEIATNIAREMVTEFGMSDLGPVAIKARPEFGIWAREMAEGSPISQAMADKVDIEVGKIIDEGYKTAQKILSQNRKKLDLVAHELLEKETLEGDEFERLVE